MALTASAGELASRLDETMGEDEVGGLRPEIGAKPRSPPYVLRERARETRIARFGELDRCVVPRLDLQVAEALADEQLFKLRFLLQIRLLISETREIERRHGDVDVAALEQLGHVAVEEREHKRADMCTVHVGVRHDDHTVVAKLRDVELFADAGADRPERATASRCSTAPCRCGSSRS